MVFVQDGWTLYKRDVKLKNTKTVHTIYFFSKKKPKSGTPADLPDKYTVGENKKTGFKYIKRKVVA
jgi:hypothetical protein